VFCNFLANDRPNDDDNKETPITTVSTSLIDCNIFDAILPTINYWTAHNGVECFDNGAAPIGSIKYTRRPNWLDKIHSPAVLNEFSCHPNVQ
jgi:hypothetical protein